MEIFKIGDEIAITGYKSITLSSDIQTTISNFAEVNGIDETEAERILNSVSGIRDFMASLISQDEDNYEITSDFDSSDVPKKTGMVNQVLLTDTTATDNNGNDTEPVKATNTAKKYVNGELANGYVNNKYYVNGLLATGVYTVNGVKTYFENGVPTAHSEQVKDMSNITPSFQEIRYGDDGQLLTGIFNNRQYVNGKVLTGIYENNYYKDGVLDETFTGTAKDPLTRKSLYCENGIVFTGLAHKKYYVNGELANGYVDDKYYDKGTLATGVYTVNGIKTYFENGVPTAHSEQVKDFNITILNSRTPSFQEIRYGDDGQLLTGIFNNRQYVNGKVLTGIYENNYYKDGVLDETFTGTAKDPLTRKSLYCENGIVFTGLAHKKYYVNGELANGYIDDKYYDKGTLATGVYTVNGVKTYFENGVPTAHSEQVKDMSNITPSLQEIRYGDDGQLLTGIFNNRQYINGKVLTGIYENNYYKDGVLDETFTGTAKDPLTRKSLYCENGIVFTGLAHKKYYVNGELANGYVDDKYYDKGTLATGVYTVNGVKTYFENGVPTAHSEQVKDMSNITPSLQEIRYGDDGQLLTGIFNNRQYVNGKVLTGIYENNYYKDGVLDETFTGYAYEPLTKKSLYCVNGVVYSN